MKACFKAVVICLGLTGCSSASPETSTTEAVVGLENLAAHQSLDQLSELHGQRVYLEGYLAVRERVAHFVYVEPIAGDVPGSGEFAVGIPLSDWRHADESYDGRHVIVVGWLDASCPVCGDMVLNQPLDGDDIWVSSGLCHSTHKPMLRHVRLYDFSTGKALHSNKADTRPDGLLTEEGKQHYMCIPREDDRR